MVSWHQNGLGRVPIYFIHKLLKRNNSLGAGGGGYDIPVIGLNFFESFFQYICSQYQGIIFTSHRRCEVLKPKKFVGR